MTDNTPLTHYAPAEAAEPPPPVAPVGQGRPLPAPERAPAPDVAAPGPEAANPAPVPPDANVGQPAAAVAPSSPDPAVLFERAREAVTALRGAGRRPNGGWSRQHAAP